MKSWIIFVGFIIIILPILIIYPSSIRILLGILIVLFLPGAFLCYLLFPYSLDTLERIVYSIGLSICIVVIDGLILDRLWEISLVPIVVSLGIFIFIIALGIFLRRIIEVKRP
jgi:uncharacterized membrane protein